MRPDNAKAMTTMPRRGCNRLITAAYERCAYCVVRVAHFAVVCNSLDGTDKTERKCSV